MLHTDCVLFYLGVHRIKIPHKRKVQSDFITNNVFRGCRLLQEITKHISFFFTCFMQKYFIVMQSVFYPDDRINAR